MGGAAIVIPALNEAKTLGALVSKLIGQHTVVVVDDGSDDSTANVAADSGADVVLHDRTRGYDAALASGFARANARGCTAILSMDADGQHDPSTADRMISLLINDELDLVVGIRPSRPRLAEKLFVTYARMRFGLHDVLCGLKAYRIDVYRRYSHLVALPTLGTALSLAALKDGARLSQMPVAIHARTDQPRLGAALTANGRILRAWAQSVASRDS